MKWLIKKKTEKDIVPVHRCETQVVQERTNVTRALLRLAGLGFFVLLLSFVCVFYRVYTYISMRKPLYIFFFLFLLFLYNAYHRYVYHLYKKKKKKRKT